tara:strand:- start:3624 stop:4061 length:438 start_codon:yes stop_codon:yes gene_type:complete
MAGQQGRFFRPKPKALKGTPYDSMTEKRLHEGALKTCTFHSVKIPYHIEHQYEPDFIVKVGDKIIYIEVKGYFQDRSETQKYNWVKKALKPMEELVFVFEKPDKPMHFQAKRKDGTKMTHREWCVKQGFRVFSEENAGQIMEEDV